MALSLAVLSLPNPTTGPSVSVASPVRWDHRATDVTYVVSRKQGSSESDLSIETQPVFL